MQLRLLQGLRHVRRLSQIISTSLNSPQSDLWAVLTLQEAVRFLKATGKAKRFVCPLSSELCAYEFYYNFMSKCRYFPVSVDKTFKKG